MSAIVDILRKWTYLFKIIRVNGGPFKSFYKLWRMDSVKEGTLMGSDAFGNKYYENQRYKIGRNRWVEYAPHFKWDYDGSQVSAEWFGWLHYKTDCVPCQDCAKWMLYCHPKTKCWLAKHEENLTGTELAYYPYSTVRPFIHPWDGTTTLQRLGSKMKSC